MRRRVRFGAVGLALALVGCSATGAPPDAGTPVERIPVMIDAESGTVTVQAEIADTPNERSRGLMFRETMEDGHGMIFLFPDEQQRSFWMKNTLIPLDMIFIRSDKTILGVVENAEPRTTTSRMVPGASQYVLEINGGRASELGIRAGQTVRFIAPIPQR